jgi:hypothetical protein
MSRDALFQLGMGSVVLNAAQKEELPVPCAVRAHVTRFHLMFRQARRDIGSCVPTVLNGVANRRRGNSAQARLPRGGAVAASVFS